MLASLTMLWPGYFADPPSAPPIPSFIRASVAGYLETFASVAGHLAGGFSERLGEITPRSATWSVPSSPMPVSQGEQTAALLPNRRIFRRGHCPGTSSPSSPPRWPGPCTSSPAGVARALARLARRKRPDR